MKDMNWLKRATDALATFIASPQVRKSTKIVNICYTVWLSRSRWCVVNVGAIERSVFESRRSRRLRIGDSRLDLALAVTNNRKSTRF